MSTLQWDIYEMIALRLQYRLARQFCPVVEVLGIPSALVYGQPATISPTSPGEEATTMDEVEVSVSADEEDEDYEDESEEEEEEEDEPA